MCINTSMIMIIIMISISISSSSSSSSSRSKCGHLRGGCTSDAMCDIEAWGTLCGRARDDTCFCRVCTCMYR